VALVVAISMAAMNTAAARAQLPASMNWPINLTTAATRHLTAVPSREIITWIGPTACARWKT
jgi:hypothetical protein